MISFSKILLIAFILIIAYQPVYASQEKITICHKPGTEDQAEISVSVKALQAHLKHGDTQGECESSSSLSEGCIALNNLVPREQDSETGYIEGVTASFKAGETVFASLAVAATNADIRAAVNNEDGAFLAFDQEFPIEQIAEVMIQFVIPLDGLYTIHLAAKGLEGGTFKVDSVKFSCT